VQLSCVINVYLLSYLLALTTKLTSQDEIAILYNKHTLWCSAGQDTKWERNVRLVLSGGNVQGECLDPQPQGITAFRPVQNFSAWWQTHWCE